MKILIQNLNFSYTHNFPILNDISLSIEPGELVGLAGKNGSGKTTLVRHFNGLLKPDSGSVLIGDWNTKNHSPAQLAHRVAVVFQNPDDQLFCRTVWDEIAFGPKQLGCPDAEVRIRVENSLRLTQLNEYSQEHPHDLGYSNRKLVTIGSTLSMGAPIIIFDEPTAGMDSVEISIFSKILRTLKRNRITCIVISHDMDFIVENLERLIILYQGKILADGRVSQVLGKIETIPESGITLPQIYKLADALNLSTRPKNPSKFVRDFRKVVQKIEIRNIK
jgi:energy-coupling factor transport system ATP-binding protein